MTTIVCVLRSGGDFSPDWVHALRRGCMTWLNAHRFVCLSDLPLGVWAIPLKHSWPGWWAKVEIFRPGLFDGPVMYLDLDTLPVGDLSDLASYTGPMACLNDFYQGRKMIGSGVLLFTPGEHTEAIYEAFKAESERLQSMRGRSDYFYRKFMGEADRVQELFPDQVVTLKPIDGSPDPRKHGPPEGSRLVAAHGRPRFTDPAAGWAHRLWMDRAKGVRRAA